MSRTVFRKMPRAAFKKNPEMVRKNFLGSVLEQVLENARGEAGENVRRNVQKNVRKTLGRILGKMFGAAFGNILGRVFGRRAAKMFGRVFRQVFGAASRKRFGGRLRGRLGRMLAGMLRRMMQLRLSAEGFRKCQAECSADALKNVGDSVQKNVRGNGCERLEAMVGEVSEECLGPDFRYRPQDSRASPPMVAPTTGGVLEHSSECVPAPKNYPNIFLNVPQSIPLKIPPIRTFSRVFPRALSRKLRRFPGLSSERCPAHSPKRSPVRIIPPNTRRTSLPSSLLNNPSFPPATLWATARNSLPNIFRNTRP